MIVGQFLHIEIPKNLLCLATSKIYLVKPFKTRRNKYRDTGSPWRKPLVRVI